MSRDPEAVIICCSFVPANCPRIVCVMAVGGCTVKLYINMEEVVAILLSSEHSLYTARKYQYQRQTERTKKRIRLQKTSSRQNEAFMKLTEGSRGDQAIFQNRTLGPLFFPCRQAPP